MARSYYFVLPYRGCWHVQLDGKRYGPFASCETATGEAVAAAKKRINAKVLVQGADDRFRPEWSSQAEDDQDVA